MRPLFATRLELHGPAEDSWRTARAAARLAAGRLVGGWPPDADPQGGEHAGPEAVTLRWSTLGDAEVGRLWTLEIDEPVDGDRSARRRTTAWVEHAAGRCAVQVAVELRAPSERLAPLPVVAAGAPPLVRELVERLEARDAEQALHAGPVAIDARTLGAASILATDPRRRLPVVAVREAPAVAHAVAAGLAGVAHTWHVDAAGATELGALLGLPDDEPGTLRVLWPGWQLGDGEAASTAWRRRSAIDRPDLAAAPVVAVVAELAAARLEPPALRRRLEDVRLAARVAEIEPAPEQQDPPERWEEDLRALGAARQEVAGLHLEVDRLHRDLDDVVALLAERFEEEVRAAVEQRGASRGDPVDLGEAIARAADELEHVVVLPAALEQARRWPYLQPAKVLRDLRALDALVGRWRRDELTQGFDAAAQAAGLSWARGVSSSAHQLFPGDYRVRWEGRELLLGPHLRYGAGPPTRQCRLYFARLSDPRLLLLGHVGSHLRGAHDR